MLPKSIGIGVSLGIALMLCSLSTIEAYSKYGRGCSDIGCLPNQECVIVSDSCSYNQRDGKDCGSYPTCQRKAGGGGSSSSAPASPAVNPSGFPHGLQPVNPYNPSFIFGQQPYYPQQPGGTGGPPGGGMGNSMGGILGGGGGGLAPPPGMHGGYGGGYQNPNMFNKPPPQFQNQNPYNRQTQSSAHSSAAAATVLRGGRAALGSGGAALALLMSCVAGTALLWQWQATSVQQRRLRFISTSSSSRT